MDDEPEKPRLRELMQERPPWAKPPVPGDDVFDHVNGRRYTVIASVMFRDEEGEPEEWTVLLLRPIAPYFLVATVVPRDELDTYPGWRITVSEPPIENIVPAVERYKEWGGDY